MINVIKSDKCDQKWDMWEKSEKCERKDKIERKSENLWEKVKEVENARKSETCEKIVRYLRRTDMWDRK